MGAVLSCSALYRNFPIGQFSYGHSHPDERGNGVRTRIIFHLATALPPRAAGDFSMMLHSPIKGIAIAYYLHANASQFVGRKAEEMCP